MLRSRIAPCAVARPAASNPAGLCFSPPHKERTHAEAHAEGRKEGRQEGRQIRLMPRGYRADGSKLGRPKGSGIPAGGVGWGGPARGASDSRYSADNPPDQEAAKRGREMAAKLKELLAPHIGSVAETWLQVMLDPQAPPSARIVAAEKIAERVEGKVSDKLALLDTRSADELTDEELAIIASRGREPPATEAADKG